MDESQTIRVSVEEAATLLGIEKGSVKKRIQRGKLRSEKDVGGTTWVYLDRSETVRDQSQGRSETDRDELVGELRDRVRSLERRLDDEGESRRRADTIIAQLTQATSALTERLRELKAPQTSEEAAQGAAEAVAGVPTTQGTGEVAESRTEPRWMQNRWTNWLVPALFGSVFPIVIAALGAVWVYISTINGEVITAVVSLIVALISFGFSFRYYSRFRREQREAEARSRVLGEIGEDLSDADDSMARSSESLDNAIAELERRERRQAWIKERLKEEPELEQRMEELREEFEKEHPS